MKDLQFGLVLAKAKGWFIVIWLARDMDTKTIDVNGVEIKTIKVNEDDWYFCISDFAPEGESGITIQKWLSNKNTIELLGIFEEINNPSFNMPEFDHIKNDAGTNRFLLSVKQWTSKTGATGIFARAGKYNSGTYAHVSIALEFASWLNPEFKLYIIKEFQRLKKDEALRGSEEWDIARILSKINYTIHTDAVKNHILPQMNIAKDKQWLVCASEADILNFALFGKTAKEFKDEHPREEQSGKNMRDFASTQELIVLKNLESASGTMIREGLHKEVRLAKLTIQAKEEMDALLKVSHKIPGRTKAPPFLSATPN